MEAVRISETSFNFYATIWSNIQEDILIIIINCLARGLLHKTFILGTPHISKKTFYDLRDENNFWSKMKPPRQNIRENFNNDDTD
jgi:hypothetical protein